MCAIIGGGRVGGRRRSVPFRVIMSLKRQSHAALGRVVRPKPSSTVTTVVRCHLILSLSLKISNVTLTHVDKIGQSGWTTSRCKPLIILTRTAWNKNSIEDHTSLLSFEMPCMPMLANTATMAASLLGVLFSALQIILDLCLPEKELAKTRSQISFL